MSAKYNDDSILKVILMSYIIIARLPFVSLGVKKIILG